MDLQYHSETGRKFTFGTGTWSGQRAQ